MTTQRSPEKKKGRQASYVPPAEVAQVERNETNDEKILRQSNLDKFFASHNDQRTPTKKNTKQQKISPDKEGKRTLSAIQDRRVSEKESEIRRIVYEDKDEKSTENTEQVDDDDDDFETNVDNADKTMNEDDSMTPSDTSSEIEIIKIIKSKKATMTTTNDDDELIFGDLTSDEEATQQQKEKATGKKKKTNRRTTKYSNKQKTINKSNNEQKEDNKLSAQYEDKMESLATTAMTMTEETQDDRMMTNESQEESKASNEEEKATNEEETNEESMQEATTNEEATNEEASNAEATNKEKTNEEATNEEVTEEETNEEATNEEATNEEVTNKGATIEEAKDEEIDMQATNEESNDETSPDIEMREVEEVPLASIEENQQEEQSQAGGTVNNSDDEMEIPTSIDFDGNVIRKRKMFVKIKVKCQPSSAPAEEFLSEMAYVITQFKAADSRFLLAPYPKEVQPIPTPPLIHGPERLPARVSELRAYFPNFYPRDNGGDYYVKALIGFDKPFERIMETIGWELRMKSAQIFKNDLQVAETQKAGWFLWSLDSMALKDLEKDLEKRLGHIIALRYGAINMGERMQFLPKEVPRAVYVETEATTHVKTARYLSRLYHKSQTIFR